MGFIKSLGYKIGVGGELFAFLFRRKLWWLIPVVIVLILFAIFAIFGASLPIAPFIYTLF
jgi:hypothetical protein